MKHTRVILLCCGLALAAGCASNASQIPGTKIEATPANRSVIEAVEKYRLAVERQDTVALMLMASKDYWEDGGTASGADDYGYKGLRKVLKSRLERASDIRYSLRYMRIRHKGKRVLVDVLIDASYSMTDGRGELVRKDMRDQNQLVLEREGEGEDGGWKFVSGM
jgi:hypothetical protein